MLAAAAGRPVKLRAAAVAAAYRDRRLTLNQCAALFGVSRTTIMKFLAAEGVAVRRPGRNLDERAVAAAYRDERLSLRQCAARFGISERRVAAILDRQGVPRRPVGRPPRHPRLRDTPEPRRATRPRKPSKPPQARSAEPSPPRPL
jgi:transcriptional regulator with XRE-family HTH domain